MMFLVGIAWVVGTIGATVLSLFGIGKAIEHGSRSKINAVRCLSRHDPGGYSGNGDRW